MLTSPLAMAIKFLGRPAKQAQPAAPQPPAEDKSPGPLPIEDPVTQRCLMEFFDSHYWPYLRDLLMREIIGYQASVDKQLQGALASPRDPNGKIAAYHGGRIRAGDEIKLLLERLKQTYSK